MPKTKRNAASSLPKHAPKRTGRRGIKPLETEAGSATKRLPGMEDHHLPDLEEAALNYARVRDERMAMLKRELDLKDVLHTLMKRHSKTLYRVEEMEIKVVARDETVKVKLLKDKD